MKRIDWIKKIYPDFKEKKWIYDNVISPKDIELKDFYIQSSSYEDFINPKQIVGISYAYQYNDFNKINWLDLLNQLKRLDWVINTFKTHQDIEYHIHNNPEPKCVAKYGEKYITCQGQHRLCLSKFLNITKVKVNIIEYKLDKKQLKFFNLLQKNKTLLNTFGLNIESHQTLLKYSREQYLFLYIQNFILKVNIEILEDFVEFYTSIKINFFNKQYALLKTFMEFNYWIEINTINDLIAYKHLFVIRKNEELAIYS
ncbi:hypothetical protein QJU83_03500 [Pasteurella skyensis]|uniref:hypothetical protein n=1 Tax=Phocoenobacter skyensis TaxID=97481 RepID=UPI0027742F17|nr:hypothetical protein [Pasteurella skyensis]MDP8176602.1 hypothetical protein [Pasteurella skyensis]MDP8198885.1 hypothetical protein [Pasteurella skyensis]